MGAYGKNMRSCCDSVAQRGTPHIKGCVHFRTKTYFVQMDDSNRITRFDGDKPFDQFLKQQGLSRSYNEGSCHAMVETDTLQDDAKLLRRGIVVIVEQNDVVA